MTVYWSIFWRTFAAAAAVALSAALTWDWAATNAKVNAVQLVVLLGAGAVAGLLAAGWAFVRSPAQTALDKAIRSLIETVVAGLGVIALNSVADWVALPKLLVPLVITAVGHFVLTFFQNQGTVPQQPPATDVVNPV
jgi:hypothetical protein